MESGLPKGFDSAQDWTDSVENDEKLGPLSISNISFTDGFNKNRGFFGYAFMRPTTFIGCTFPVEFPFARIAAAELIEFVDCVFKGVVLFSESNIRKIKFGGHCSFTDEVAFLIGHDGPDSIEFEDGSKINARLSVSGSQTARSLRLKNCEVQGTTVLMGPFGTIVCEGSVFHGKADLSLHEVDGANFAKCRFENQLTLSTSGVLTNCDFSNSNFGVELTLGGLTYGEIRFDGCRFDAVTVLAVAEPLGAELQFDNCLFKIYAEFDRRTFGARTSFEGARFKNAPSFFGAVLFVDTTFEGAIFEDTSAMSEGKYRALRGCAKAIEAHHDEQRFFALEMKARRAGLDSVAERFAYWVYQWTSDYGRSLMRPLWSLTLVVVFSIVSLGALSRFDIQDCDVWTCSANIDDKKVEQIIRVVGSHALPFVPILKDGGEKGGPVLKWNSTKIELLAILVLVFEAVASLGAIFLFLLGLRNQFRLKSS